MLMDENWLNICVAMVEYTQYTVNSITVCFMYDV